MHPKRVLIFAWLCASAFGCSDNDFKAEEPVMAGAPAEAAKPSEVSQENYVATKEVDATAQKIFYDATLKLEVLNSVDAVEHVASMVKAAGGYVEEQARTTGIFRIPVKAFGKTFDDAQALGKVLDKSVLAFDVSEAYSDATLRRELMQSTLTKLETLLKNAQTASERLVLLKEIGVLKERLEKLASQIRELGEKAAYSRLALEAIEPAQSIARGSAASVGALAWLSSLSPDSVGAVYRGRRLELVLPDGFVAVPNRKYFEAESATSSTIRATRLENNPRGDKVFWGEAVQAALGSRFKVVGSETAGRFVVVHAATADGIARYDVAVATEGDDLLMVEAFYPSAVDLQRFGAPVIAAVAGFGGSAQ